MLHSTCASGDFTATQDLVLDFSGFLMVPCFFWVLHCILILCCHHSRFLPGEFNAYVFLTFYSVLFGICSLLMVWSSIVSVLLFCFVIHFWAAYYALVFNLQILDIC